MFVNKIKFSPKADHIKDMSWKHIWLLS